ncbi:MAG: hypothetical protein DRG37_04820 [Deltaproteobacteria bacterium]|nr:MAG: hypothetical protein DRG37_04820 [Deltaproteobacteria bacterium]
MPRIIKKSVVYLVLAALAACITTASNILNVQTLKGGVISKKVEINDRILAKTLSFGKVALKYIDSEQRLMAQVLIQNRRSRDVSFEYKFIWYDENGFEISPITSWIPATLSAKESRGYTSVSPGPGAQGFKLLIRRPHALTGT